MSVEWLESVEIKAERWIKPKVITAESAVELNSLLQWIVQAAANLQQPSEPIYCSQQRIWWCSGVIVITLIR